MKPSIENQNKRKKKNCNWFYPPFSFDFKANITRKIL